MYRQTFWESDTWLFLSVTLGVCLIFCAILGAISGVVALTQHNACERLTVLDTQHTYHYDFWLGCVVKLDNGRWISITDYQQIQLEEGK